MFPLSVIWYLLLETDLVLTGAGGAEGTWDCPGAESSLALEGTILCSADLGWVQLSRQRCRIEAKKSPGMGSPGAAPCAQTSQGVLDSHQPGLVVTLWGQRWELPAGTCSGARVPFSTGCRCISGCMF